MDDESIKKMDRVKVETVKNSLIRRGFEAEIIEPEEVVPWIRQHIPSGAVVGYGGSVTLNELGVIATLREGSWKLLDRDKKGNTAEEKDRIMHACFTADYYLLSANAITMSGQILEIDGRGNRVAALSYGPEHVIMIAGTNKIVTSEKEGWNRVVEKAAVQNARRLGLTNEKMKTCGPESGIQQICDIYVKLERQMVPGRIKVLLVPGSFGF